MLGELSQSIIMLMGGSFVLGSIFTIAILIIFDVIKAARVKDSDQ